LMERLEQSTVLVNPSMSMIYLGAELGIRSFFFVGDESWVHKHRATAQQKGMKDVGGPVKGAMHYVGTNGPIKTKMDRWIAMIPTPWKLANMYPGASVAVNNDTLQYHFLKKTRTVSISYTPTANVFNSFQVDSLLRQDATAYWIETTEEIKIADSDMYVPFSTRYLPSLPPYRLLGGVKVSYDNHYVYDVEFPMTVLSRRKYAYDFARQLSLQVAPLSTVGLVPVDWDTLHIDHCVGRPADSVMLVPSKFRPIRHWSYPGERVEEVFTEKETCPVYCHANFSGLSLPMISAGTVHQCLTARVGSRLTVMLPDTRYEWCVIFGTQGELEERMVWLMELALTKRVTLNDGAPIGRLEDQRIQKLKSVLTIPGEYLSSTEITEKTGMPRAVIAWVASADPHFYRGQRTVSSKMERFCLFKKIDGLYVTDERHRELWYSLFDIRQVKLHARAGSVDYGEFSAALARNSIIVSPAQNLHAGMELYLLTNLRCPIRAVKVLQWAN